MRIGNRPNPVREKSYQLALRIVCLCRANKEPSLRHMMDQLLRCSTSIVANIEEATAGQSRKDFAAKMSIASKEAREARFWLRLFRDAQILNGQEVADLLSLSEELVRLLTSIVKTTKETAEYR